MDGGSWMSGYAGPDNESEHALILSENAIHAARQLLPSGNFRFRFCQDCGEEIPQKRRELLPGVMFCVACAEHHLHRPRIRMLDHIL